MRCRVSILALALLGMAGAVAAASAVASDCFLPSDSARFQKLAQSALASSDEPASLAAAASVLASLNAVENAAAACDRLKPHLASTDVLVLRHAISAAIALKCAGLNVNAVKPTVQAGLKGDSVASVAAAGHIAFLLAESGKGQLSDFDLQAGINTLLSLAESDGTFKPRAGSDGNPLAAGTALEFLGKAHGAATEDQKKKIKGLISSIETLLELGTSESDDLISFRGSASRSGVGITVQVLRGVLSLLKALPGSKLDATYIERIGAWLASNKYTAAIEDAADLLWALSALSSSSSGAPRSPVAVTLQEDTVKVTDLMGKAVSNAKASLTKVIDHAGAAVKGKDGQLTGSGAGTFKLPSFTAGVYRLVLSTEVDNHQVSKITRTYAVNQASVQPSSCEVQIFTKADASDAQTLKATFPNQASGSLKAAKEHTLRVKVTLDGSFDPLHALATFTRKDGNLQSSIPLTKDKTAFQGSLNLGGSSAANSLSGTGDYTVGVLIGDPALAKPVNWACGTVYVTVNDPQFKQIAAEKLQQQADTSKEISYPFRPQEKRPNALIALIFAVLTALPFVGFLQFVKHIGLNIQLPKDGFLSSVVFQLSILSILLVIVRYWIGMNIIQGISMLSVVCLAAIFSGNFALRASAEEEDAASKKVA